MKSSPLGSNIFSNNITSITKSGFWILVENEELFVAFSDYPEFKTAPIEKIFITQLISPSQIRWPELDIDIELNALKNPTQYPLHFK